jgi:hypothetical protein
MALLYAFQLHADQMRKGGQVPWDRFNQPKDQQLWYYRSALDAFKCAKAVGLMSPPAMILLKELEAVVLGLGL